MGKNALVPFLLCLFSACATPTTTYETDRPATYTTDIVGRWFPCEFIQEAFIGGYRPTDDCVTLDDDGLLFAGDGTVSRIEFTGGNRMDCAFGNVGKCFRYDADDLPLKAAQIATWVKEDNSIKVTRGGCVASLVIQAKTSHSVFRAPKKSHCRLLSLDANATRQVRRVGGVLMRRHVGTMR